MELETVIGELAPRVVAYCRALTRDSTLAEDAAQDALAALVRRWRQHGPPRSSEAFVFTVARRRSFRSLLRQRLLVPFTPTDIPDEASEPGVRMEQKCEVERVVNGLNRLSRRDRHALLLVAVAELDCRDAAAVLGVSISALKMRVHRARRRLETLLDGGSR